MLNSTAFKRFSIYNPFLEEPEVQAQVWQEILPADESSAAIRGHLGTRMEEFHNLPDQLCDALFRWRMGWLPTKVHLESFPNIIISEFTRMQTSPDVVLPKIRQALYARGLVDSRQDEMPHLPYDICIDRKVSLPWKAWFLEQDYGTVLEQPRMTQPRNKKMSAENLPECLRELLPEAIEVYQQAMSSPHVINISEEPAAGSSHNNTPT